MATGTASTKMQQIPFCQDPVSLPLIRLPALSSALLLLLSNGKCGSLIDFPQMGQPIVMACQNDNKVLQPSLLYDVTQNHFAIVRLEIVL